MPVLPAGGKHKERRAMEDQRENTEQDNPAPLTDEELAEFQRKENRKVGIIGSIIEFILGFFH